MAVAEYTVEVSWSGSPQAPVWDDLSGIPLGLGATDVTNLTTSVKSLQISRGRPSDLATMAQGVCSLRLADPTGQFNPQNPTSALHSSLVPMKPIRVSASYAGTQYWLFRGFVSRIEYDPSLSVQETTIEAVDLFEFLNIGNPAIVTQTNQTVSALIGTILDNLGWTTAVQARNFLGTGDTIPSWSADGTKSALQLIQGLLQTDLGVFFIDGQGRPTYLPRTVLYVSNPVATLDGSLVGGLKGTTDVKNIINKQSVTRTGGVTQTSSDATSQTAYGQRTGQAISSSNLVDDNAASSLANLIVTNNKQPRPPARNVALINRDGATITQQLTRELFDAVTVNVTRGGTNVVGPIQTLTHAIADGGLVHKTSYVVQGGNLKAFTIGVSTIGGSDVIVY